MRAKTKYNILLGNLFTLNHTQTYWKSCTCVRVLRKKNLAGDEGLGTGPGPGLVGPGPWYTGVVGGVGKLHTPGFVGQKYDIFDS